MNKWHFFSSFTVFLFILLLLLLSFPFFNFFFTFFRLFESFRTRNVGGEVRIENPELNAIITSQAPNLTVPEGIAISQPTTSREYFPLRCRAGTYAGL